MEKFARQCSITGELMNEGWVWGDGVFYTKHLSDTLAECRRDREHIVGMWDEYALTDMTSNMIEDSSEFDEFISALKKAREGVETDEDLLLMGYNGGYLYYTEWEEGEDDFEYGLDEDGNVIELEF